MPQQGRRIQLSRCADSRTRARRCRAYRAWSRPQNESPLLRSLCYPHCEYSPHDASIPWRRHEIIPVSYTHLRAHETDSYLVCRLLLEKKKKKEKTTKIT